MLKKSTSSESALSLIEYPSRFPLKVFGNKTEAFEKAVHELVSARCPENEQIEISMRDSKGGKYLSITLTFTAYSQQQLEQIYADLYLCEHVVMSL
jgi:putative lipoic acid-binding regulatory protein